jgi:hypothetical protein
VHPEGNIVQGKRKRRVAPLEHVVHPEGHVVQGKWKEATDTLGAPSVS